MAYRQSGLNIKAILSGLLINVGGGLLVGIAIGILLSVLLIFQGVPLAELESQLTQITQGLSFFVVDICIGFCFTFWGGFKAAYIARSWEILHAGIVGAIAALLSVLISEGPIYRYDVATVLFFILVSMLGGYFASDRANESAKLNINAVFLGLLVNLGGTLLIGLFSGLILSTVIISQGSPIIEIESRLIETIQSPAFWIFSALVGLGLTFLGGFTAARIARSWKVAHAGIVGAIAALFVVLLAEPFSIWYGVISFLLAGLVSILGGYVGKNNNKKPDKLVTRR